MLVAKIFYKTTTGFNDKSEEDDDFDVRVAGRNIPSKEIKAILPSASLWETLGQGRVPTQPPNQGDVKPWKQVVDEVREHSGNTSVYGFVFRCAEQRTSLDAMVRTTAQ
ncbi:hypothetical protein ElyMa_000771900 [Elysia marginata]|uniref:Uncharacterized protein n=1 Tax=Elysia marginata TaxID=1093978 RepID=A0AAV4GRP2_9GAST|nr:hypothetical protein ElyMa_000771900 [Elysia marginata]